MVRRAFLALLARTLQIATACVVAIPGVRFLSGPRRTALWDRSFTKAVDLDALEPGQSVRAIVSGDRWDAYTHYPPGPIGGVWLRREPDVDGSPVVRCFQTICPHLGCGIDWSAGRGEFSCPCHASVFDADGRVSSGPSPRGIDELEARVTAPDPDGKRWVEVRYQEFRVGIPEKQTVS